MSDFRSLPSLRHTLFIFRALSNTHIKQCVFFKAIETTKKDSLSTTNLEHKLN